jgi:class 3 adenylate cyclase
MSWKFKAYSILIGFFCFICWPLLSQDQRVADSLTKIYRQDIKVGPDKLELLRNLAFNQINDAQLSLKYAEELITLSKAQKNDLYLYRGYLQKGNRFTSIGELDNALEALLKAVETAKKAKYKEGEGSALTSIADVYSIMGNFSNAEGYYDQAITILKKTDDSINLASALLNAGDAFFNEQKYDKALQYFEEAGLIFKKTNYLSGNAYNLGNIGMVYAAQGKDRLAEANINEAIRILEELKDYYPISVYLTYMSDIYLRRNDFDTALNYANRSLSLSSSHGLKDQISEANLKLSELFEYKGDFKAANQFYKDHIAYRDSVKNIQVVQQLADQRTNYEVSQKQAEVDLLNQQKKNQLIILGFTGVLLLSVFWYYRTISKEKKRSDTLLLNILPAETAKELKEKGKVSAKKISSATVLFTDFKGFTKYSENLSPESLVEIVGFYFSKFDEIIEKYGLEKIKTMGDAYMCAGGLHSVREDTAHNMVLAAIEILQFVEDTKIDQNALEKNFEIRLGINTGAVVAGVVGKKKFAYDIWGDTVNVAARMEAMSEPGKINISENTYKLIKDQFTCEYRGEMEAKNRGKLKMYYVSVKNKPLIKGQAYPPASLN